MTTSHDPDDSFQNYIFFLNLYSLILVSVSNSSNLHSCILAFFFLYFLTRSRKTKYCIEFSVFFFILYPVFFYCFLSSCILYSVSCIFYPVSCIMYLASCIIHPWIIYSVSRFLYSVSCTLRIITEALYRIDTMYHIYINRWNYNNLHSVINQF